MNIILDTNIIRNDFFLRSYYFRLLIDFVYKTSSTIVIPQIAKEELLSLYEKELCHYLAHSQKYLAKLNELLVGGNKINLNFDIKINEAVEDYQSYFTKKMGLHNFKIIEYKNTYLDEIIKRAIGRIKPMSSNGQEFRDTLLWLSILDYLHQEKYKESIFIFITNNTKDFADESQENLHPDLQNDLKKQDLNLKFYRSLSEFVKETAIKIDFISTNWLIDNLDWNKLDNEAKGVVEGIHVVHFFDYYYKRINENEVKNWEVISANFDKKIPLFFIYEMAESDYYKIEIFLNGESKIKFADEQENIYDRNVDFWTTIYINIDKNKIIYYESGYYEEESGFN